MSSRQTTFVTFVQTATLKKKKPLHKFRHGHIQYGAARAKTFADFKAISLNVMHSSIKTTNQAYSNYNIDEVEKRIKSMGRTTKSEIQNDYEFFQKFLDWHRSEK